MCAPGKGPLPDDGPHDADVTDGNAFRDSSRGFSKISESSHIPSSTAALIVLVAVILVQDLQFISRKCEIMADCTQPAQRNIYKQTSYNVNQERLYHDTLKDSQEIPKATWATTEQLHHSPKKQQRMVCTF